MDRWRVLNAFYSGHFLDNRKKFIVDFNFLGGMSTLWNEYVMFGCQNVCIMAVVAFCDNRTQPLPGALSHDFIYRQAILWFIPHPILVFRIAYVQIKSVFFMVALIYVYIMLWGCYVCNWHDDLMTALMHVYIMKWGRYVCSWHDHLVDLGAIETPFQLEFEVTRGGDIGYFALDNINLTNCDPG